MDEGAVDALVPHLCAPVVEEGKGPVACEHEVEKDAAFALGLLAVKVSQFYNCCIEGYLTSCMSRSFERRHLSVVLVSAIT